MEELIFTTVPPSAMANLFSLEGPKFTVAPGDPNEDPNYSLMVYYDPEGPTGPPSTESGTESQCPHIGLGAVLANPLLERGEPVATYLMMTRWNMDRRLRPSGPRAFLVGLHKAGETFVYPGSADGILVDPCAKGVRPEQASTTDPPAYRMEDLRFFQLHNVNVPQKGSEELDLMVCFPRLNGGEARLIPSRRELVAEESKRYFSSSRVSVTAPVTSTDESHHWSLIEDTAYPKLLASQEAAEAKKAKSLEEVAKLTASRKRRLEELEKRAAPKASSASTQAVIELLQRLHYYRMQYLYEEGSVRALDRTLHHAFMQEFTRVNLIVWEDLGNEITTLVNSLGTRFDALINYIKGTSPEEPSSYSRSVMIGKAHQCRLEWATELMALGVRMEGAKGEMENFLQQRLNEVSALEETKKTVSELAERWTRLESAVRDVVLSKEMEDPSVASRVGAAIAGGPTFQGNYVLGSLETLLGSLRLSSGEGAASPRSTSMAIAERQIASLGQAFGDTERNFLTERLRPNYTEAFQQQRLEGVPKAFQEPLLPGLIATMDRLRFETPGLQEKFRAPLTEQELRAQELAFTTADEGGRERIFKGLLASYKTSFDFKVKTEEEPRPQGQGGSTGEPLNQADSQPQPNPNAAPVPPPKPQRPTGPQSNPKTAPALNTKPPPGARELPKGATRVDVHHLAEWQRDHPYTSVHLGGLDPDLIARAKITDQGEPIPPLARGEGGGARHPPAVRVSKHSRSTEDADLTALEEPASKVPRLQEDYEGLQGKIFGDATFRTSGGGSVFVTGKPSGSIPRRGGGSRGRGGVPGASEHGGALVSLPQEGDEDPPQRGRTTRQSSGLAPAPLSKKGRRRKSREDEEDNPASTSNPTSKGGRVGEQVSHEPVGAEDNTPKQEEVEGKYPPALSDEEDEPEDLDKLGPIPVFDPIAHDLVSQEEADSWRDGVLRKRAWIYYWDKRIAMEVRGGILGVPNGELPCYERIARSPYFQPIRAKEIPKPSSKATRKNTSPGKGGAAAWEPLDISPYLVPILQKRGVLATGTFDKDRPTGGAPTIYEWGTLAQLHPEVLQQWKGQTPPALVVIIPIEMEATTNTYGLDLLHVAKCLPKTTVKSPDGKIRKQMAFCPYCGVMSENNESHLNHVRRHTRMEFLCGGCLSMHSPFLTLKGTGSMAFHLKNCKSLKECRDQKRRRYDQARQASALTRMEEEAKREGGYEDDEEDDDDDDDDVHDKDYHP